MPGKQTMTWNGEADSKLLLAILKVSNVKPDLEAVAKQLTTDQVSCTPRAVMEHLKKLRKLAQADPDRPTPTTSPSKAAAVPAGVKKTRKPATGGKGKKGRAAVNAGDAEDSPVKMETGGAKRNDTRSPKKRNYDSVDDGSSDVGEGSVIGSESEDLAQAGSDAESTA